MHQMLRVSSVTGVTGVTGVIEKFEWGWLTVSRVSGVLSPRQAGLALMRMYLSLLLFSYPFMEIESPHSVFLASRKASLSLRVMVVIFKPPSVQSSRWMCPGRIWGCLMTRPAIGDPFVLDAAILGKFLVLV